MHRIRAVIQWAVQALLDVIGAVSGFYYSKKYAAISKWLGLPRSANCAERGFIVIQIDGLAHHYLTRALDLGYAPYLERLLRHGEFALRRWYCGLPSTTPASQAGIMFGNNDNIPAFRWYNKERNEVIVCKVPAAIQSIQERISAGHPGILASGSSFLNMFDGDASLSMFTMGAMNRKRFFESVRGFGFFILFLLNPYRSLKTLALAIWDYGSEIVEHVVAFLKKRTVAPLELGYSFVRVMGNVVFREIQTFALMVDIYRGMPALYTTYYGYDHLAHHYGSLSKSALRALHAIDTRIHQIDRLRRLALTREYDLYILSDHGMTEAIPFRYSHNQTLGEAIRGMIGNRLQVKEGLAVERLEPMQTAYLLDELSAIEANLSPSLAHIPRKIRSLVLKRAKPDDEVSLARSPEHPIDLVVLNSGSLSHIYLNVTHRQMSISEIASLLPNLLTDLVAHPAIWLVIGREDEQVVVLSRDGVVTLGDDYHVEGRDPLAIYPTPEIQAAQIRRMARFAHAGDLMLMGHYDAHQAVVCCFEDQWACHGGLGGPQEIAFLIMDSASPWNLEQVTQAPQMYPFFAQAYLERQQKRVAERAGLAAPG